MSDYYSNGRPRWDDQFRETYWERQERQRKARQKAREQDEDAANHPTPQETQ